MQYSNLKIFIVDDSALLRERLARLLTEIFEVQIIGEAESRSDAVHQLQTLRPDVVILDLRLPDGSGLDIISRLRKTNSQAISIVLTSFPFPQYRERSLAAGADYFFDKSEEFEQVKEIICKLSEQRSTKYATAPQQAA